MKNIVFDHVVKAYDKNVIVKDLNMEIREGERLILLGPSGCGGTLCAPTAGRTRPRNVKSHGRTPLGKRSGSEDDACGLFFRTVVLFPTIIAYI